MNSLQLRKYNLIEIINRIILTFYSCFYYDFAFSLFVLPSSSNFLKKAKQEVLCRDYKKEVSKNKLKERNKIVQI